MSTISHAKQLQAAVAQSAPGLGCGLGSFGRSRRQCRIVFEQPRLQGARQSRSLGESTWEGEQSSESYGVTYGRNEANNVNFSSRDGETWSYSELAAKVGRPKAVRAVGQANGANPLPIVVPCHRVIGRDGTLTGFGGGVEVKRLLLSIEGCWMEEMGMLGDTGRG